MNLGNKKFTTLRFIAELYLATLCGSQTNSSAVTVSIAMLFVLFELILHTVGELHKSSVADQPPSKDDTDLNTQ